MFQKMISAGEDIKPWLLAGPFYKNMMGTLDERTYFENRRCRVGEEEAEEAIAAITEILRSVSPRDNEAVVFPYEMTGKWRFFSTPEIYQGFGDYFVTNHLGVLAANTLLYSDTAQKVSLRVNTRQLNRVRLLVNGEVVLDNPAISTGDDPVLEAEVPLRAGENAVNLISMRIARNAEIGWQLQLLSCESPVTAVTPLNMEAELRAAIERSLSETHMEADTFAEGVPMHLVVGSRCAADIRVRLTNEFGKVCFDAGATEGAVTVCEKCEPGVYTVEAVWMLEGEAFARKTFTATVYRVLQPLPGYENLQIRQRRFLEACADLDPFNFPRFSQEIVWARYALGQYDRITYPMIKFSCDIVERRDDCADFVLVPLLRIVLAERRDAKLPPRYVECIRHAALNFKYWPDEANDCLMWFDSENHRLGFHTLEYMAGLLFPQEIFTNSGQNGLFHSFKARTFLMEWLSQRLRFGYDEFHSETYLPITIAALVSILEIAPFEEFNMIAMIRQLLDLTVFYLASNRFEGAMASPRGRSYNLQIRNALQQGMSPILYILFGDDPASVRADPGPAALASGTYIPPRHICAVGGDYSETISYYKSGLVPWGNKQSADITAIRTPEYMLASVRDHNVAACEGHLHVAQATLPRNTVIFFSAPFTRQEGSGLRPDYWSGQAWTPETYQYRSTLGVCWWDIQNPFVWMTHCHFDTHKFDEVRHEGHWTFGRVDNSYVGIWSANAHALATTGNYAYRELISEGKENIWILELGSAREDGSFDAFTEKLLAAQILMGDRKVTFHSPKNGILEFCPAFTVDGALVPIRSMTVENKYISSRFGSAVYDYRFNGEERTVWSIASSV